MKPTGLGLWTKYLGFSVMTLTLGRKSVGSTLFNLEITQHVSTLVFVLFCFVNLLRAVNTEYYPWKCLQICQELYISKDFLQRLCKNKWQLNLHPTSQIWGQRDFTIYNYIFICRESKSLINSSLADPFYN